MATEGKISSDKKARLVQVGAFASDFKSRSLIVPITKRGIVRSINKTKNTETRFLILLGVLMDLRKASSATIAGVLGFRLSVDRCLDLAIEHCPWYFYSTQVLSKCQTLLMPNIQP